MTPRSTVRVSYLSALVTVLALFLGFMPGADRVWLATAAGQAVVGRVEVARCVTADGTLLRREADGKPWQMVKQGETLHSGDLLIGLSGAALETRNGAARLTFRGDLSGTSPLPILESAVILRDGKDIDFEFTLDRGRVDVANLKKAGAVRVRMLVQDGAGEATLTMPGSRVALEIYGRWPAGVPFTKNPKPEDRPALSLLFLVLQGEVALKVDNRHYAMKAPPGPALIQADVATGGDLTAQHLDKLPSWAEDDANSPAAKKRMALQDQLRQLALKKSISAAVEEFLNSDDPEKRRGAVIVLGALDDLPRLGLALATAKHHDILENGIMVMRHWIGRGPGQDQKLYNALIKDRNFTEVDARTVLQLLHGFGENDRTRPELYESLIDYLEHEKVGLRCLAHWHLARLVPAGQSIKYNPVSAKEARQEAVAQWRKLIPSGQLPPKSKPDQGG